MRIWKYLRYSFITLYLAIDMSSLVMLYSYKLRHCFKPAFWDQSFCICICNYSRDFVITMIVIT